MSNGLPIKRLRNGMIKLEKTLNGLPNGQNTNGIAAAGKPKKVYAPNLNVVRNKNKEKEVAQKVIDKKKKFAPDRKNFKQDEGRYVQSQGTFSSGAGIVKKYGRPNLNEGERQSSGRSSGSSLVVPKVEKLDWSSEKRNEANKLVEYLLDCEDEPSIDFEKLTVRNRDPHDPIVLPLSSNEKPFLENFAPPKEADLIKRIKIKQEIKQEPKTENIGCSNIFNAPSESVHDPPKFILNDEYNDDNLHLSIIQLPASFAAKGFKTVAETEPSTSGTTSTTNNKPDQNPNQARNIKETTESVDFNAGMFEEGQLGRILVRQSGKIEVHIGENRFILDGDVKATCTQEVMLMPNEREGNSEGYDQIFKDDMIIVGDVMEHLILSPCWQQLFIDKSRKKNVNT